MQMLHLLFCKTEFVILSSVRHRFKTVPRYLTVSFGSLTIPLHSLLRLDSDLSVGLYLSDVY